MIIHVIRLLSVSLLCVLFFSGSANGQGSVKDLVWYHAQFPPVTIPSGPDAGTGFYDKITQSIIQKLPEYYHRLVVANYQRILHEIEEGNNVCCASLYKTAERDKFTAFSIPVVVVLPNGITIKKKDRAVFSPFINSDGEIELEQLLSDQNLRLGIAEGRKYSGGIDEILQGHISSSNVIARKGSDVFKGLLDMLFRGRIDYLLGYPVEAQYLAGQIGRRDEILFYPVAEVSTQITLGHVGCPDTPWGRLVIEKIDEILRKHRATPEFYEYYENWLDDQTAKDYRKIASDFFANDPN